MPKPHGTKQDFMADDNNNLFSVFRPPSSFFPFPFSVVHPSSMPHPKEKSNIADLAGRGALD